MKKILAILLVVVLMLSLVACGGDSNTNTEPEKKPESSDNNTPAAPSNSGGNALADDEENAQPIDNTATGEIGMYNPDYDYAANKTYKVCYYVLTTGVLYEAFGDAFAHWCSVANMEYGGLIDAGGNKDQYLSNLTTLAGQYDGILIDPDAEQYTRCAEILNETTCAWMGCMAAARDYTKEGSPLLHPYCGFDNVLVGEMMVPELMKIKNELWPDVDDSEFGFITVDFSVSPPLHERATGCYNALTALDPSWADRYYVADCSISTFDVDTSNTVVSAVLAEHSDIEYWLVFAEIDDMAQGAAAAFDTIGLTDTAAVVTFGGTGLQLQWDAGQQDAWREACYLPQTIYAEPIIFALYAYMNGDITPEDIWPEWVDAHDGGYAKRLLPAFWITYENYQHVIRWSDIYAGSDYYPAYPSDGITRDDFSTKVNIPASYAA